MLQVSTWVGPASNGPTFGGFTEGPRVGYTLPSLLILIGLARLQGMTLMTVYIDHARPASDSDANHVCTALWHRQQLAIEC